MALATTVEDLTLTITKEVRIRASLETAFETLLEQMGPSNETPDGQPLPMTLEAWPGGRWFRDLGKNDGHYWGLVQAIKRPTLVEIAGPLFMSYAATSNLQYRLTPTDDGTLLAFRHTVLGLIDSDHRNGLERGWDALHERIQRHAAVA